MASKLHSYQFVASFRLIWVLIFGGMLQVFLFGSPLLSTPRFCAEALDQLWVSEVHGLGYDTSREGLIESIPTSGTSDFKESSKSRKKLFVKDLVQVIRRKMKAGEPKRIFIIQAGLGSYAYEAKYFVEYVYRALASLKQSKREWEVELVGFDLLPSILKRARAYLGEDFPAADFPRLKMKFARVNFNNSRSLERAAKRLQILGRTADYILHSHVSYPNLAVYADPRPPDVPSLDNLPRFEGWDLLEAINRVDGNPTGAQQKHLLSMLRIYLPYRNLLAFFGKDDVAAQLGTRLVIEKSPIYHILDLMPYQPDPISFLKEGLPTHLLEFVPPGMERMGGRGQGFLALKSRSRVLQTTIRNLQESLKAGAIPTSVIFE